jgi:NADH:ubiquinone oxidoreductase subunit F (NADH-binding)
MQISKILDRIAGGQGTRDDLRKLEVLARVMYKSPLCALGQTAPVPVMSTLKYFRSEYEAHIDNKQCPAAVCTVAGS